MALDVNDLALLKSMNGGSEMTPYESVKLDHLAAKSHTSGVAIAGLTVGIVGTVAGVTAWIFGGMQANAKGKEAKEAAIAAKEQAALQYQASLNLMNQQNANTNATLDRVVHALERETDARVSGDVTLNQTITDTVSGQQASTLTAQQQAELAASQATQQVMTQTYSDFVTGRASLNPTPVSIWQAAQACNCPGGCGCGQ